MSDTLLNALKFESAKPLLSGLATHYTAPDHVPYQVKSGSVYWRLSCVYRAPVWGLGGSKESLQTQYTLPRLILTAGVRGGYSWVPFTKRKPSIRKPLGNQVRIQIRDGQITTLGVLSVLN